MLTIEQIEHIRQHGYPMYQRYWCCGENIGDEHANHCPSRKPEKENDK